MKDLPIVKLSPRRSRRKSKYGSQRVKTADGERFDSKAERRRYYELRLLEKAGKISDLRRQVPITLIGADGLPLRSESGRRITYRADFTYLEDGILIREDRKGYATPDFKLKLAILKGMGIRLRLT